MAYATPGLTVTYYTRMEAIYRVVSTTFGDANWNGTLSVRDELSDGNSSLQADKVYTLSGTALDSTGISLDIYGNTSNPDIYGNTLSMKYVCGLMVQQTSTTAARNLLVGGGTNGWESWVAATGDKVVVGPEGVFSLWNPRDAYLVTAGTGDVLKLAAGGAYTVDYTLMLVGRSG